MSYLSLQDWLNTPKEGKRTLNDMQGNVTLLRGATIESLLYSWYALRYIYVSKYKDTKTES